MDSRPSVEGSLANNTSSASFVADNKPVAANDTYSTFEDTVLSVPANQGLLANDTDADGDALTVVSESPPSQRTLSFNANGSFVYTPTAAFRGADTFTYTASDGALTATARVTVAVSALPSNTFIVTPAGTFYTTTISPMGSGNLTATFAFPADAVSQPVTVSIALTDTGSISNTMKGIGAFFTIEARAADGSPVTSFAVLFTITVQYSDADVVGMDESTLKIYYWNEATEAWVVLPTVVDPSANTLTATVDHLTKFGAMGIQRWQVYLPVVEKGYLPGW